MIYAVDFDGTIVEDDFPNIGEPKLENIKKIKKLKENGHILILWTCRVGDKLTEAINFCKSIGLTFQYINENIPERIIYYKNDCRKIGADYYIDDKSIRPEEL